MSASPEPLDWTEDGPRSPRFGDVYFSTVDGLAEARAVFLRGCGLPERWNGRDRFTVAELGFGTGLNILALLDLWRSARPPGARLDIFSVEAFPIGREDAARALAAWPELADLAAVLLAQWPDRRGWRRIAFPGLDATLDLAVAEAGEALARWDGAADAWFLDGFAPARNPEMWRDELMALVAARAAPGACAATFTVAGQVRRALAAAGFSVEKRPGFGRKRERLEAIMPGEAAAIPHPRRIAVVGAGIAGAALARALFAEGQETDVYAGEAGASANPGALVTPWLDAGLGRAAWLHAQAFSRAVALVPAGAVVARGVVRQGRSARDPDRFARIAGWDAFPPGALQTEGPDLVVRDALVVEPQSILDAWLAGARRISARVAAVERAGGGWRLKDADGAVVGEADAVCLAAGPATAGLAGLALQPVRGQLSWTDAPFSGRPSAWGGYAAPLRAGFMFGATHDRGDTATDIRDEDNRRNLRSLAEGRPDLAPGRVQGRASTRAATADHQPVAGRLEDGLFVLSGLGGRGFTLAPLLAEMVAAMIVGAPSPMPRDLAALVDPGRYRI